MPLMNPHQEITLLEDVPSSRFFSWWQYITNAKSLNSQVFIIMICLQQNSLSQIVDYTIKNYNLYSSLNSS
jgi:hypothetical protein